MPTLAQVAQEVADELTRVQPRYHQDPPRSDDYRRKSVYNPTLVKLGEDLKKAVDGNGDNETSIRSDVSRFAAKMSTVMDEKVKEKGPATQTSAQALQEIQFQLGKFQQIPFPGVQEIQKILVHIANFAMIAEAAIERDGVFR